MWKTLTLRKKLLLDGTPLNEDCINIILRYLFTGTPSCRSLKKSPIYYGLTYPHHRYSPLKTRANLRTIFLPRCRYCYKHIIDHEYFESYYFNVHRFSERFETITFYRIILDEPNASSLF